MEPAAPAPGVAPGPVAGGDEGSFVFPLDGSSVNIGRDASCGMRLLGMGVSRLHAVLRCDPQSVILEDQGSVCGIEVNGRPVERAVLRQGDTVTIGVNELRVEAAPEAVTLRKIRRNREGEAEVVVSAGERTFGIGRDAGNEICIDHPLVSRFHAELRPALGGSCRIVDLGSTNGTFVNGRPVRRAVVNEGDVVQIGPHRFRTSDGKLLQVDDCNRVAVRMQGVAVRARGLELLSDVSMAVSAGEFLAVLGPSGAGKTTLVNALAGRVNVSAGAVLYNGLPLRTYASAFSARIGFVAQENVLHRELTVWETFVEQSILRLPRDSLPAERRERIRQTMELLGITRLGDRRIAALSGGEARRVHLGVELLSSPTLVILDEPLAGLDSGLVRRFMELFRTIASGGRTLVLTTHTLEQIDLCDRVVFVNRGRIVYDGAPGRIASSLGVATVAEAYEAVRAPGATAPSRPDTRAVPSAVRYPRRLLHSVVSRHRPRAASAFRQAAILVSRYARIWARDARNVLLVLVQAPLIAVLLALVFGGSSTFLPPSFFFCAAISAIWCGGTNAIREIAREWACFEREYRVGLSVGAYVVAKSAVFGLLSLAQGLLFALCLAALFDGVSVSASTLSVLGASSVAGALLGLCLSAWSANVGQAVSLLPLAFIPQIFFSGILLPFDRMPALGRFVSHLTISRPAFSLFKMAEFLDQDIRHSGHWIALLLLAAGSIILVFAGTKLRPMHQRW